MIIPDAAPAVSPAAGRWFPGRRRLLAEAVADGVLRSRLDTVSRWAFVVVPAPVGGSPDAIFAKNRQGRHPVFKREAARVTAIAADDLVGRNDHAASPGGQAEQIRHNDEALMAQDRPATFEELIDTRDGPVVPLSTKGPLQDAEGRVVGTSGLSRNITDLERARQACRPASPAVG